MVAASLGMAGLYVQNPKQFWTSVDTVTSHYQYLKPVGSNIIWPDFQVYFAYHQWNCKLMQTQEKH